MLNGAEWMSAPLTINPARARAKVISQYLHGSMGTSRSLVISPLLNIRGIHCLFVLINPKVLVEVERSNNLCSVVVLGLGAMSPAV